MTKPAIEQDESLPENYLGALDIGSNSFHFVFARVIDSNLQILHSEKYQVKLASGLDSKNHLDQNAIDRAISTLKDIAPLTSKLTPNNFRVVATYTMRKATNAHQLLAEAAQVFPFDIEVISGHEEARLIYQGVAHHTSPNVQRIVIDIGGGSTECVLGKDFDTKYLTSLNIGCVSFYSQFFANGELTQAAFKQAITQAELEAEVHAKRFQRIGWQQTLGTSGTIKAIYNLINANNELPLPITVKQLHKLKDKLIKLGHVDAIDWPNLKENRRKILAPGLAILIGIMEMLKIKQLTYCEYSLREGVLFEQFESLSFQDVRQRTINSLSSRFNIDLEQAGQVKTLAKSMFNQVRDSWKLNAIPYERLLLWSAQLHEIGFDINTSAYHRHGKYILLNADLPGFNVEQQQALAYLVENQRKKAQVPDDSLWYVLKSKSIVRCAIILRLAILLNQQRQLTTSPAFEIHAQGKEIELTFEQGWLEEKAIIRADLENERQHIAALGYQLQIKSLMR